ncbi:MAG: tetratricopeptide repeat protein [Candidatus Edwardsbacteria bacterium]|jgi:tetratricopeptide (TPR) repeat protein|nr:tetratricopeptide repeat protein [Candidatus Edwardsbacteria bacterium]
MERPTNTVARTLWRSVTGDGRFPMADGRTVAAFLRAALKLKQGEVLKLSGMWERARQDLEDAVRQAELAGATALRAEASRSLGFQLMNLGQYDNALLRLDEARDGFAAVGDVVGAADTIGNKGSVHLNSGDINKAEKYFLRQLELGVELQDPGLRISSMNNLGVVHLYRGDYRKAIELFGNLLEESLTAGSLRGQSSAHGNMALAHLRLNETEQAMGHFQADLEICQRTGDKGNQARVLANIGDALYLRGEHGAAERHLFRCLDLCRELGDKRGESYATGLLGSIREDRGDQAGALSEYDRAIALSREIRAPYFAGVYLNSKASLLYEIGRFDEAAECNREAGAVVTASGVPDDIYANRLLAARLAARTDSAAALAQLDSLLADFSDDEEKQAGVLFHRYRIGRQPVDRERALELNRRLLELTGNSRFQRRIDELSKPAAL